MIIFEMITLISTNLFIRMWFQINRTIITSERIKFKDIAITKELMTKIILSSDVNATQKKKTIRVLKFFDDINATNIKGLTDILIFRIILAQLYLKDITNR